MQMDLSPGEALALKAALDIHLIELEAELVRTSKRELQRDLHSTYDQLDLLRKKLSDLLDHSP